MMIRTRSIDLSAFHTRDRLLYQIETHLFWKRSERKRKQFVMWSNSSSVNKYTALAIIGVKRYGGGGGSVSGIGKKVSCKKIYLIL
jgi:hypothetical protein